MTPDSLNTHLAEIERDALLAYYLGQIVPHQKEWQPYREALKTSHDLYEWLLIDNQVTGKITSSRMAEAISSLQLYLHRVRMKLEPGVTMKSEEADNWEKINSQYSLWAANKRLTFYPENYINPTLRQRKTPLFAQLESSLSQGRINEDSVQTAMLNYLNEFETVSNLRIVSAYQDGLEPSENVFYFIGCTSAQPCEYYWRTLNMHLKDSSGQPYPTAWSAWFKIGANMAQAVNQLVRAVYFNNRLHLIWLERREKREKENDFLEWSIQLSFKRIDDSWSAPQSYPLSLSISKESMDQTNLLASVDKSTGNDKIIFGLYTHGGSPPRQVFTIDELFNLNTVDKKDELEKYPFEKDKPTSANQNDEWVIRPVVLKQFAIQTCKIANMGSKTGDVTASKTLEFLKTFPMLSVQLQYPKANTDLTAALVGDVLTIAINFELKLVYSWPAGDNKSAMGIGLARVQWDGVLLKAIKENLKITSRIQSAQNPATHKKTTTSVALKSHEVIIRTLTYLFDCKNVLTFKINSFNTLLSAAKEMIDVNFYFEEKLFYQNARVDVEFVHRDSIIKPWIRARAQAQFLFTVTKNVKSIRLNTLFAKELVNRAGKNLQAVFHYGTQSLQEPASQADQPDVPMDFQGANGLYFWELFFHAPFLISYRLTQEGRYKEAAQWLAYLFDVQTASWPLNPLKTASEQPSYAYEGPSDPDALAMADPVHYRKVIFLQWIQLLQQRGDASYRQLTRDGLVEAKLYYSLALKLLGPRPMLPVRPDTWKNPTLGQLLGKHEKAVLRAQPPAEGLTVKLGTDYRFSNVPTKPFLLQPDAHFQRPYNRELLARWDQLETRLQYLRHALTLEGRPMVLPLFATPLDPRALQAQQVSASAQGGSTAISLLPPIPPYRFAVMLQKAYFSVDSLIQLGHNLLSLLERKEGLAFETLQYSQQAELLSLTHRMQTLAIDLAKENKQALMISKTAAETRQQHYQALYDENISDQEQTAIRLRIAGSALYATTSALRTAAAIVGMVPNIYGMAVGGAKYTGPIEAAAWAVQAAAETTTQTGYIIETKEQYRRRRQEWEIQEKQARADVDQITIQLRAESLQLQIAEEQLRQTEKQQAHYQEFLDFFSTRFTKKELYHWMNTQLRSLYYQVYGHVLSLCLSTQAAWQYEMSRFDTLFIQTGTWEEHYNGLLAGEKLKFNLQRMDQDYLLGRERYLELIKTVSLKQYLGVEWDKKLQTLREKGTLDFQFTHCSYDQDYPGHYLRKIKTVSISLPALIGPYQDVRAVLTQTSNAMLYDKSSVDSHSLYKLYMGQDSHACPLKENLRASQQIALSTGIDDNGLFILNYEDERYLPFEGTGAVSNWQLQFPRCKRQQQLLHSLTDVIVQIRYTAVDGGPAFREHVEQALDKRDAETAAL